MNDDENSVIKFGTPLDPLDEDELPSKKPIQLQDQKVYDENGLQRFHGAFTGGFSAGYFNTVGTKEGWTPSEFVSSRSQKSERNIKRPEDFMDAEDLREFGIAPKRIQTKEQFRNENKQPSRSFERTSQVIPGIAPLLDIIRPVSNSIGVILLQKLGWRPGKGVGPKKQVFNTKEKLFGCALPPGNEDHAMTSSALVSPSDVDILSYKTKNNVYGLGYTSLKESDKFSVSSLVADSVSGHIKLGRSKTKVAFRGQAFGVGAFEDDDEEIYVKDDLSSYDFSLEDEHQVESHKQQKAKLSKSSAFGETALKGFVISSHELSFSKKLFPPPDLPSGYTPKGLSSVPVSSSPNVGSGRFLNRFALCAVDRTKLLGSRFEDSSKKLEDHKNQHPLAKHRTEPEKCDTKVHITPPNTEEIEQNRNPLAPPLRYPTVLSTKFVPSSVLEPEEVSYGLSRPSVTSSVPVAESDSKTTMKEHKCQRLIEDWRPLSLLCKRFNIPNPFPESGETSMSTIAAKRSSFKSIFRSLFDTSASSLANTKEVASEPSSSIHDLEVPEDDKTVKVDFTPEVQTSSVIQENEPAEEQSSNSFLNEVDFKPPTPPTMDLFNDIFKDSSDESSVHSEDEAVKASVEITKQDESLCFISIVSEDTANNSVAEIPMNAPNCSPNSTFYGPALPPVSATPINSVFNVTPNKSSEFTSSAKSLEKQLKHSKHKSRKRKSHHKSHKKHKKKKLKRSRMPSDDSSSDRHVDTESESDVNEDDVNYKLIHRLKQMRKSK